MVAVVAHFANRDLDNSVTTSRGRLAGGARRRTHPTAFELAAAAAAIAILGVAVVAVLARFDALVATLGDAVAGLSGVTMIGRVLNRAGGIATIVVESVAVVANLARADGAVATNDLARTSPRGGTIPVRFDLACAVAPVAGQDVAVVTLLNSILIVLSVAACLRILGLAARSVVAFACPRAARRAARRGGSGAEVDVPTDRSASARIRTGHASLAATASRASGVFDGCVATSNCRQRKNHRKAGLCQRGYKSAKRHCVSGVGCFHRRPHEEKGLWRMP